MEHIRCTKSSKYKYPIQPIVINVSKETLVQSDPYVSQTNYDVFLELKQIICFYIVCTYSKEIFYPSSDSMKSPQSSVPRPKLHIALEKQDIIIIWLTWIGLLVIWIIALYGFVHLPETIPVHFNVKGEPDGFGGKWNLFFLPGLTTALLIGLTLLNRHPEIFNYPVKITAENAERQYKLAVRLIRWVNLSLSLMFLMITFMTVHSAALQNAKAYGFVLPLVLLLSFVPLVAYFAISVKTK